MVQKVLKYYLKCAQGIGLSTKRGPFYPHLPYSHVVVVCGTNNLREDSISHPSQISHLVEKLKFKLHQIRKLCPKANITVMPVLPSRLPRMNRNIVQYNDLAEAMLAQTFNNIWFPTVHQFLDKNALLALNLTRNEDPIHLGTGGVAKFVRSIKHWVYQRELLVLRERSKKRASVASGSGRNLGPERAPW